MAVRLELWALDGQGGIEGILYGHPVIGEGTPLRIKKYDAMTETKVWVGAEEIFLGGPRFDLGLTEEEAEGLWP